MAHAWDATFFERQKQFDDLFTQRHPNIEITAENTTFADYLQKYTTQAAGGRLPDVMYTQFSWAQQLIRAGLFQQLDDYIAKQPDFNLPDFTPQSLVSYQHDGKTWGIPYDEGPGNLYYNKDLFDAAGVAYPDATWTLDRLKEVALKLTSGEGGGEDLRAGRSAQSRQRADGAALPLPVRGAVRQRAGRDRVPDQPAGGGRGDALVAGAARGGRGADTRTSC